MTSSADRYTKPAAGEDPREIDRELTDAEFAARREANRQVTHAQEPVGEQGISSDAPGFDPSNRDQAAAAESSDEAGADG
jgi:hypothetical protein